MGCAAHQPALLREGSGEFWFPFYTCGAVWGRKHLYTFYCSRLLTSHPSLPSLCVFPAILSRSFSVTGRDLLKGRREKGKRAKRVGEGREGEVHVNQTGLFRNEGVCGRMIFSCPQGTLCGSQATLPSVCLLMANSK